MTVKWMYHATAMGADYDAILEPLQRLLGCQVMHDQVADTPGIERRGGMTWIADNAIEIGEPHGATSPVRRFLERFGGGMHSVAVQVDDVDIALGRAATLGVRVADRPLPGVAFTRPGDTDGLLFEWNHNEQHDDPRWGASAYPVTASVLQPSRFAWVSAVVPDPPATGRRLAEVLATDCTLLDDSGRDDAPAAAVAIGDCSLGLFPLPTSDRASTLWGTRCERPRFVALAVTVADMDGARAAVEAAGLRVSSALADGSLVLHGQGLPFPVIATGGLLAGDPRS